jgi:hypothetical protein
MTVTVVAEQVVHSREKTEATKNQFSSSKETAENCAPLISM